MKLVLQYPMKKARQNTGYFAWFAMDRIKQIEHCQLAVSTWMKWNVCWQINPNLSKLSYFELVDPPRPCMVLARRKFGDHPRRRWRRWALVECANNLNSCSHAQGEPGCRNMLDFCTRTEHTHMLGVEVTDTEFHQFRHTHTHTRPCVWMALS